MQKRREGSSFGRHKTRRNRRHAERAHETHLDVARHLIMIYRGIIADRKRVMDLPGGRISLRERTATRAFLRGTRKDLNTPPLEPQE